MGWRSPAASCRAAGQAAAALGLSGAMRWHGFAPWRGRVSRTVSSPQRLPQPQPPPHLHAPRLALPRAQPPSPPRSRGPRPAGACGCWTATRACLWTGSASRCRRTSTRWVRGTHLGRAHWARRSALHTAHARAHTRGTPTHTHTHAHTHTRPRRPRGAQIPGGALPRTMDVILRANNVDRAKAGDRVSFCGTLVVCPDANALFSPGQGVSVRPGARVRALVEHPCVVDGSVAGKRRACAAAWARRFGRGQAVWRRWSYAAAGHAQIKLCAATSPTHPARPPAPSSHKQRATTRRARAWWAWARATGR